MESPAGQAVGLVAVCFFSAVVPVLKNYEWCRASGRCLHQVKHGTFSGSIAIGFVAFGKYFEWSLIFKLPGIRFTGLCMCGDIIELAKLFAFEAAFGFVSGLTAGGEQGRQ